MNNTNNNTKTVQYALASTVNGGLLCRKGDGTLVVSTEYEEGEQYEGEVKTFDNLDAAIQYLESTESWGLTPVEFTKSTESDYNTATIVKLLLNASWSWVMCGVNHRAESLDEQTSLIEETITEYAITQVLEDQISNILSDSDFDSADDKNVFIAEKIADSVAHNLTDYDYDGVSYIATF